MMKITTIIIKYIQLIFMSEFTGKRIYVIVSEIDGEKHYYSGFVRPLAASAVYGISWDLNFTYALLFTELKHAELEAQRIKNYDPRTPCRIEPIENFSPGKLVNMKPIV